MPKVDSAEITHPRPEPGDDVVKHVERLDAGNVERLIGGYDVIVDGTDNFDTRYVLNDAAVKLRKPVVHGSIYRWDGQITTFVPFEGPCYRCMYPTQPPEELAPGLQRRRRARRPARDRRHAPGQRGLQAGAGRRRDARRPAADVRRAWARPSTRSASGATPPARPAARARRCVGRAASRTAAAPAMSTVRIPPVLRENTGGSRTRRRQRRHGGRGARRPVRQASGAARPGDRGGRALAASSTSTSTTATCATARASRRPSAPDDTIILLPAMAGGSR